MAVTRPAVELVDLHKNFKQVQAVRGMTLSIDSGEIVALLGPNGARPVAEVLERAGISGIADRRVGKCSGGEQQRPAPPSPGRGIDITWVINAVVWFGLFVAGAVWRFRKDTARV